jgi:RNA polymerase sigma-70 factor (ECF subfamily)
VTNSGDVEDFATAGGWTRGIAPCDSHQSKARSACRSGMARNVNGDGPSVDRSRTATVLDEYAAVVAAVAGGSASALAELYDASVGKVHALIRAMIRNVNDAEEVTCDVYTHAWQTASQFDPARGPVMAWLLTIARSRALDALRRQRSRNRLAGDDAPDEVADPAASTAPDYYLNLFQTGSAVHAALAGLPSERRQLIGLAYFDDLSHSEIANRTGLPIGTVKSHLRRALHTLRESLYVRELE